MAKKKKLTALEDRLAQEKELAEEVGGAGREGTEIKIITPPPKGAKVLSPRSKKIQDKRKKGG